MHSVGVDIGYSSVKVVMIDDTDKIKFKRYHMHRGRIKGSLLDILKEMATVLDPDEAVSVAITGNGAGFLGSNGEIKIVNDVTAVIEGAMAESPKIGSIIDIGGQNARFITGIRDKSRIQVTIQSPCGFSS